MTEAIDRKPEPKPESDAGPTVAATAAAREAAVLRAQLQISTDALLLVDERRRIVACNPAFLELWRLPAGSLEQSDDTALQEQLAGHHHDPLSCLAWVGQQYARSSETDRTEWQLRDGRIIECTSQALPPATPGSRRNLGRVWRYRDITEQRRSEQKLQMLASVHQSIGDAVAIVSPANIILAINPAFSVTTGYLSEEVIGRNIKFLAGRQQTPRAYEKITQAVQTTGYWKGEVWHRLKNGEEHLEWMEVYNVHDGQGLLQHRVILFSDIADQKLSEETLLRQTYYDALTELPNRRLFIDRIKQEAKKVRREGLMLALLFIDLDHFKEVNDTLGHRLGDQLIIEAARRIGASVRDSDTVARLGGDEFAVILSSMGDPSSIDRIVESILRTLSSPFQIGKERLYLSASIGITLYPDDADKIDDLLKHADQALYVAKNNGRNCSSYFTRSMQDAAEARLRLSNDLRGALENNQFQLHYQPIVELATGCIHKAEALIRWQHPELGTVNPATFIPLAEDMRTIIEIGDWVFKQAAHQVRRLRDQHHPAFQITVNKSPVQFNNDDILYKSWFDHLNTLGLPGSSISIEITEGLLLDSASKVLDRLSEFNHAGIQVALDDFGTGYSSLSYLKKFDIDYLKIDQSFVRDLEVDESDKALCEAIIAVAHKLGLRVIAEGIETEGQRRFLAEAGCDYGQGFLFSRPKPAHEFEHYLNSAQPAATRASAPAIPHTTH
jgi:diguanylate cyclase (GGDEF)-like protein/PAS domain S-box-containing protein